MAQRPEGNEDENYLVAAKELHGQSRFDEAIRLLVPLAAAGNNPEAIYYLGSCYLNMGQAEKAIAQYDKLDKLFPKYDSKYHYEKIQGYLMMAEYDKAEKELNVYTEIFLQDATRTRLLRQIQFRLNYLQKQQSIRDSSEPSGAASKLPPIVNSEQADYMPMLDPTGTKLYFTSNRIGGFSEDQPGAAEGDEDIYYVEKSMDGWSAPKLLPPPINSKSNEGAACFSADGQLMIFSACGKEGGVGSCDLYIATLEGNQWTRPLNMGNIVNSEGWDSQPTISFDGNRIIFCSSRNGGYGSEDLYMIERGIFQEWGPAMNLGPMVNTPFSDDSPFLSQDGKTLYFASQGHPGLGGYDLFKTVFENGRWTEPVNLGRPLNTTGNDSYFTIDGAGEIRYFSSNKGGQEHQDLFQVEIPLEMRPQPTVVVEGIVTDIKSRKVVSAEVLVEDLNSGELIAVNKSNSATGKYLVVLPAGKTYSVSASKKGYIFHSERFDVPPTSSYKEIHKDIALKPIEKGAKAVINNIFFETNKAVLSTQSRPELKKAIELMSTNPSMIIEVGGHTDNVGDDGFNIKLSQDRARAVREYLIKGGIAVSRVQARGYGESKPIAPNDTEEGRQANRRTEFSIVEF